MYVWRCTYLGVVSPKQSECKTPRDVQETAHEDEVRKKTHIQQSCKAVQPRLFSREQLQQIHEVQPQS